MSFYRSQNVLYWSKFFEQAQKIIYTLCQLQTFCARQKDDLHSVKLVFVLAQKFLKRHYVNAVKFLGWLKKFGPAQNILGPLKGQGIRLSWRQVSGHDDWRRIRKQIWTEIDILVLPMPTNFHFPGVIYKTLVEIVSKEFSRRQKTTNWANGDIK